MWPRWAGSCRTRQSSQTRKDISTSTLQKWKILKSQPSWNTSLTLATILSSKSRKSGYKTFCLGRSHISEMDQKVSGETSRSDSTCSSDKVKSLKRQIKQFPELMSVFLVRPCYVTQHDITESDGGLKDEWVVLGGWSGQAIIDLTVCGVTGTGRSMTVTRRPLLWPGSSPGNSSDIRQEWNTQAFLLTRLLSRSARFLPGTESGASRKPGPAGTRNTLIGTLAGKECKWMAVEIRKVTGISGSHQH